MGGHGPLAWAWKQAFNVEPFAGLQLGISLLLMPGSQELREPEQGIL